MLDGCLLWGSRVIVPKVGRARVLEELHSGHPGIQRMKRLARGVVWWPGMDSEIEQKVKDCVECDSRLGTPARVPIHPWDWPARPWSRIHIDHAGPFMGKMFLLAIDAHSKLLEVEVMSSATSRNTIQALKRMFASHGIPDMLVSDNGTPFTSAEFLEFVQRNGIRHVRSAPYHPATNGLVERSVQTLKNALQKCRESDLDACVSRFLFQNRITPHTTTGLSPAEMLVGRRLRTHLDLMHPNIAACVADRQASQKSQRDKSSRFRCFQVGDHVYAHNFGTGSKWLPGMVLGLAGPHSVNVELMNNQVVRRHLDQVRRRTAEGQVQEPMTEDIGPAPQPVCESNNNNTNSVLITAPPA